MMKVISRKLVRKCIEMMGNLAKVQEDEESDEDENDEDDNEEKAEKENDESEDNNVQQKKVEAKKRYDEFFNQFGKNVKLGIIEDPGNRAKLAKLTRWYSTHNETEYFSFDEYISRAKPG
jgi:heat shock protein beta